MSVARIHSILRRTSRRLAEERANAIIEMAITMPVLVFALFGVVTGGLAFDRYMTVEQSARTGVTMMARGMDFAIPANQDLLLLAAKDLKVTKTGGKGVIIMTRLVMAPPGTTNENQVVIAERHVIGDAAYEASTLGTPDSSIWPSPDEPPPTGLVKDYFGEPSALAQNLPTAVTSLPVGESMYVAEIYHNASELSFGRLFGGPLRLTTKVYF